jgi:hypothetical protein
MVLVKFEMDLLSKNANQDLKHPKEPDKSNKIGCLNKWLLKISKNKSIAHSSGVFP